MSANKHTARFSAASLPVFKASDLPAVGRKVSAAELAEHRTHARRPARRQVVDHRHLANVAKALPGLPAEGESWHIIAKGNTPLWIVVPRLIELAGEPIAELKISTLGFGRDFADCLIKLLDSGQVGTVGIVCSHYFKSTSQDEYHILADALAARNQPLAVARCHAKVIAATMQGGRGFTFEGSGNLRSCRSIEQLIVSQDAALTHFHQAWITDILAHGQETDAASRPKRTNGPAGRHTGPAADRRQ